MIRHSIHKVNLRIITAAVIFLSLLIIPSPAYSAVYVETNFFIGTGIIIGGFAVFLVFSSGGHGHFPGDMITPLPDYGAAAVMSLETTSPSPDLPVHEGMIRILQW
jgi:hypothetical protein